MQGRRMGGRVLAAAVVAMLLAGCASGGGDQAGGGEAPSVGAPEPARDAGGTAQAQAPGGGGAAATTGSAGTIRLADPGARIVRTANVRLEVGEGALASTIDRATAVVTKLDGTYVASNTTVADDGDGGAATGQVTFRVPVAAYEQALRELKGLGRYLGEDSSSKDVSSEFVDLNAQLTAWKAQERTYLKLLERARSINDVIAIQNQLSQVQQNIERLQGQINFLDDQSARSTIVLDLTEPGAAAAEPRGLLARAWAFALDGLLTMAAAAMVLAIWSLPLLLLGAIVLLGVRALRRSRRTPSSPPAPSAQA
jgi:Domain of unknown function (DUF4349)